MAVIAILRVCCPVGDLAPSRSSRAAGRLAFVAGPMEPEVSVKHIIDRTASAIFEPDYSFGGIDWDVTIQKGAANCSRRGCPAVGVSDRRFSHDPSGR